MLPDQRFTRGLVDTYVQAVLRPLMIEARFLSEDREPTAHDALVFLREQAELHREAGGSDMSDDSDSGCAVPRASHANWPYGIR